MPYSGSDDSKLPANVQKMPEKDRERWVAVFNSTYEDCDGDTEECEGKAFRMANGTVKKDYWEDGAGPALAYWHITMPQDKANYNPLGGSDTEACANCHWFMSPNQCSIVDSYPIPISPTGKSNLWMARVEYEPEPMPVRIVADGKDAESSNLLSVVKKFVNALIPHIDTDDKAVAHTYERNHVHRHHAGTLHSHLHMHAEEDTDHDVHPHTEEVKQRENSFEVFKDINGNWRWLAIVSNNFKDREDEIIEEAAHLEYVAYADETKDYGEAWLWHTPGTAWGDADFVEYVDGFLLKSGTVRPGFEDVAEALSHDTNLGVSHGFYSQYGDKGIISWYRDFEVSPLPLEVAANPWTGLSLLKKEAEMGISAKKREFLEEKLGKERVDALGDSIKALGDALVAANIDYKDLPQDDEPDTPNTPEPEDNQDKGLISAQAITDAVTKAIDESQRFKALDESIASIKANADHVPDILARLSELEKSDDDKLMDYMQAKSRNINGYRASQSDNTVLDTNNAADKALHTAKPQYAIDENFAKSLGVGG